MTITYTWNFYPLETKPVDGSFVDVVTNVHYQLHGVDDETGARSSNIGVASLSAANAEDFTAFADLTEDTVKGWVLATLVEQFPRTGEEDKSVTETPDQVEARLKENIANNIRRLNNPPIVKRAAPWGVVSEL